MKLLLSLLLIVFIHLQQSHAQSWLRTKGTSYEQVSVTNVTGSSLYTTEGPSKLLRRQVTDWSMQLYYEYGISDKFTFAGSLTPKFLSTSNEIFETPDFTDTLDQGTAFGLGNTHLSAIYGIRQNKRLVMSLQARLELPQWASITDNSGLQAGTRSWGVAPFLNFGYGGNIFSSFSIGVNMRSNGYSEQLLSNLQIGSQLGEGFWFIFRASLQRSFLNGTYDDGDVVHTGRYTDEQQFFGYALVFGQEFRKEKTSKDTSEEKVRVNTLWFTIGGGSWGQDVLKSPAFTLGFSHNLSPL